MLRFGFLRVLAVLILFVAAPYGLFKLSRAIGLTFIIAGAVAIGLAYGALKADHPWAGDGLFANLRLMGVSAAALAAYVAVSVWAGRAIAKRWRRR